MAVLVPPMWCRYHLWYSRAKSGAADSDCGVKLGAENSLSGLRYEGRVKIHIQFCREPTEGFKVKQLFASIPSARHPAAAMITKRLRWRGSSLSSLGAAAQHS